MTETEKEPPILSVSDALQQGREEREFADVRIPMANVALAIDAVRDATGMHPYIISHSEYWQLPESERGSRNGRPYLVLQDGTYRDWNEPRTRLNGSNRSIGKRYRNE